MASKAHDMRTFFSHHCGAESIYTVMIDHLNHRMGQIHTSVEERRIYRRERDRLANILSDTLEAVKESQEYFDYTRREAQACGMFSLHLCPALEAKKREIEETEVELSFEYGRERAVRKTIEHWESLDAREDESRASSPKTIHGREARRMISVLEDIQENLARITHEAARLEEEARSIAALAATDNVSPVFGPTTTPLEVWEMIQDIPVITDDEDEEDDLVPQGASLVAEDSPLGPENLSLSLQAIELEPKDKEKSSE